MGITTYFIIIIIMLSVIISKYKKDNDDYNKKSFYYKIEAVAWGMMKRCFSLMIIVFGVWLVISGFIYNIDKIIMKIYQDLFWAVIFSIVLAILSIVVLNGIIKPLDNYTKAVGDVYSKYSFGKIYYVICLCIDKFYAIVLSIGVLLCLLPEVRGQIYLCRDYDKAVLRELYKNGNVQAGNTAYFSTDLFGKIVWHMFSPEDEWYDEFSSDDINKRVSIFGGKQNFPVDCAKIGNRLVGILDDEHYYVRSMSGLSYVEKNYNWKELIQTNGEYDYDKIFEIIIDKEKDVSVEDVVSILGAMKCKKLIGLGKDLSSAMFCEETDKGYYFTYYQKDKEVIRTKKYDVDTDKPIMSVENIIMFVDSNGIFCTIDMLADKIKKTKLNQIEKLKEEVQVFNYYITDDGVLRVSLADSESLHIFSDAEDIGYYNIKLSENTYNPEAVYNIDDYVLIDGPDGGWGLWHPDD